MDSLGTAISIALQYGVPVEALVNKFTHQRFEPAGMTHNPDIPLAKSLVDYIFRWMGMQFVSGYRAANAPRRSLGGATGVESAETELTTLMDRRGGASNRATKDKKANDADGAEGDGGNGHGHKRNGGNQARNVQSRVGAPARMADDVRSKRSSPTEVQRIPSTSHRGKSSGTVTVAMREMQADAPACDVCGTITVRNGTCYKCVNCGNSMGCS